MSNRGTKGKYRVGSISVDTSGSTWYSADQVGRRQHVISLLGANASTCETDTGYDLPTNSIVHNVSVLVNTASSAASTISVGLLSTSSGGDADGYLAGASTTGTGLKMGAIASATSGAAGDFIIDGSTIGAYLGLATSGSTAVDDSGFAFTRDHNVGAITAKSVTWFTNSTGPSALAAKLVIDITELTT